MKRKLGHPKVGDYTKPKTIRFDQEIFAILEEEVMEYGSCLSDRVREILRSYYREQGKV